MTTKDEANREAWVELQPLRRAVLDEVVKPVQMTALGLDDLVDRITIAVARYMGGILPDVRQSHSGNAHLVQARESAHGRCDRTDNHAPHWWDEDRYPQHCPGTAAPGCTGCGAQITETKHGRATLHVAGCRYVGERGPQA
jgi:hypothetical protein